MMMVKRPFSKRKRIILFSAAGVVLFVIAFLLVSAAVREVDDSSANGVQEMAAGSNTTDEEATTGMALYKVSLAVSPPAGGKVTGDGIYEAGTVVTVSAQAEEGYRFKEWVEADEGEKNAKAEDPPGSTTSTEAEYTFTVEESCRLEASFEALENAEKQEEPAVVAGEDSPLTGEDPPEVLVPVVEPPKVIEPFPVDGMEAGVINVKFKPELVNILEGEGFRYSGEGFIMTGVEELDRLNNIYGVTDITSTFNIIYEISEVSPQQRESMREFGLHQWYKISFGVEHDPKAVAGAYQKLSVVELAEPVYEITLTPGLN